MEQRTLQIDDRVIYCYSDGSVEFKRRSSKNNSHLLRTYGTSLDRGYKQICFTTERGKRKLFVHRLIALAFHPNQDNLPEVDHINRNKADNRPCNLRWCDRSINESNKDCVDRSLAKYGVRSCEDRKAYDKAHRNYRLVMRRPNGDITTTGALSDDIYNMLKPLSQKDRYFKYQELRSKGNDLG